MGEPGPTTVSDEVLVARTLAGEERAFRELYLRHHAVITRRLRRLLGPGHDYEDVLQVTFVEAHRSLVRFDPGRPFIAWLHGIAFRQAANHLRSARRTRWLRFWGPNEPEPRADGEGLEDQTIRRQLLVRLYQAMDELPAKKRIAFSLHALDGLGFSEIGELLGESPQTIRARVLSARELVLKHLRRAAQKLPLDLEGLEQLV